MNNKLLKRAFPLIAILLLAPWPVTYAYNVSWASIEQEAIRIEPAEASAAPNAIVFQNAIGTMNPGDLFYVNATNNIPDIEFTLYLTNRQELAYSYAYMILKVGVYVRNHDGKWIEAAEPNGKPRPGIFLTLKNSKVSFIVQGYKEYKITIDEGCFRTTSIGIKGRSISPNFFLEVEQPQNC